jgi:murein DD-endopeptidase MepM/ murein hydrolase activator NlpD
VPSGRRTSRTRASRRKVIRVPFTRHADITFAVALHRPRHRSRRTTDLRAWSRAIQRCALLVLNVVVPIAIVLSASDLAQLGRRALVPTETASATAEATGATTAFAFGPERAAVEPRRSIHTVTSVERPQVFAHVVTPGESLLSIAAAFGVAPQTIAYNNGISDSGTLRPGQSLLIPPFDAAIHAMAPGDNIDDLATRFGVNADALRDLNRIGADDGALGDPAMLLIPVPDARYPGFRLRLSEAPRVLAPRVRWPTDGVITQLYSPAHSGVDIAAPYGSPVVATDAGTVSAVGWKGPGGLAVCVYQDWGLETCSYHLSTTAVEVGERVIAGQAIGAIGLTGETTGPHVHWETRTNGALVDPLTYAPAVARPVVGGPTGSP